MVFQFFKTGTIRNVTLNYMEPRFDNSLKLISEIIVDGVYKTHFCGGSASFSYKAVRMTGFISQKLRQHMASHITRGTREKYVSDLSLFAR